MPGSSRMNGNESPTLTWRVLMVRGEDGEFRRAAPSDASEFAALRRSAQASMITKTFFLAKKIHR